ncbi:MAG: DUF2304 domain-containing protein [Chromatiaceae bacterium]|nr:DUF2304 domain-containing protein [Chromatiaceae bacterium]
MIAFQIYGLLLILFFLIITLFAVYRQKSIRPVTLFWLVVWTAAAFALMNPNGMTALANTMGINRGADLLVYCAVLGGLVGFFMLYIRIRQMRSEITQLVRELALRNPAKPSENIRG